MNNFSGFMATLNNNKDPSKRSFADVEDSSDGSDNEMNDVWPRFLLVRASDKDRPLTKLSPFAIHKGIQGLAGTVTDVKRLRSGDILVEVDRKAQAKNLLKCKFFVNTPVEVSPHRTLNTSKGVIRCRELVECFEDEILAELRDQGVIGVHRITIKRDGRTINTWTLILTFSTSTLPEKIKCAFLKVNVSPYIPNPLRCFKCQQYGHHRNNCKHSAICGRCSGSHEDQECSAAPQCQNCKGPHPAWSKDCPMWRKEKLIQEVRITRKLTFPEARKIVEQDSQPKGQTYAQAAAPPHPTKEMSIQTDFTWLDRPHPVPTKISSSPSSRSVNTQASEEINSSQSETGSARPSGATGQAAAKQSAAKKNKVIPSKASGASKAPPKNQSKNQKSSSQVQIDITLHPEGDLEEEMETTAETPPSVRSKVKQK